MNSRTIRPTASILNGTPTRPSATVTTDKVSAQHEVM